MANTDPRAVRVANERFRVLADKLAQAYHFSRILQAQITAEGIDSLFASDKDVIEDGSATDGRSRLTNEDIKGLIGALDSFVGHFDGNPSERDLILRIAVNPTLI